MLDGRIKLRHIRFFLEIARRKTLAKAADGLALSQVYFLELIRGASLVLVVGLLAAPELMLNLSFIHLYSEPVCLVVRPGHPLLDECPQNAACIAESPVIMPDQDAVIRLSVDRLLIALGVGGRSSGGPVTLGGPSHDYYGI